MWRAGRRSGPGWWSARADALAGPADPREAVVDHVAGMSFTVAGLETTFNRSTGRSKPVRRGPGAFGTDTYVAVDAASDRAREVLGATARRQHETRSVEAVRVWLTERSEPTRRDAIAALAALDPRPRPRARVVIRVSRRSRRRRRVPARRGPG